VQGEAEGVKDYRIDAKRDGNEKEIVDALIATGHEVYRIKGNPFDIIVGRNTWCVMEIKSRTGTLTRTQKVFFENGGRAPRVIVRSVEEALEAAGRYC
jgi:Holliday junction resolvase